MKKTSKVCTSPDAIGHKDLSVHTTASGDVYCGSDSDLDVSHEVETSSEVSEALSCVGRAPSHAYAVLEHFFTHDIKLHPPDKISVNSPQLLVSFASPKSPFNKVAPVQYGSSAHSLCPTLHTDKKKKHLTYLGDKALGDENTRQPMVSP